MQMRYGIRIGIYAAITLIVLSWISFFVTSSMNPLVSQLSSIFAIVISSLWMTRVIRHMREQGGGSLSFWGSFFFIHASWGRDGHRDVHQHGAVHAAESQRLRRLVGRAMQVLKTP